MLPILKYGNLNATSTSFAAKNLQEHCVFSTEPFLLQIKKKTVKTR